MKTEIRKGGQEHALRNLSSSDTRRRFIRYLQRQAYALRMESVVLNTPVNRPLYYEREIEEIMGDGEHWPVVLGNHNSHPAGFPNMEEATYIKEIVNPFLPPDQQIEGSAILITESIKDRQNEEIVDYFKLATRTLNKVDTEVIFVVRNKDVEEGMERNRTEQNYELMHIVEKGRIPIVLPEGGVDAGRQMPGGVRGERRGLMPLKPNSVKLITHAVELQGKKPVLFFVATRHAEDVFDPITQRATDEAKKLATWRRRDPIMSAIVDYPVSVETLAKYLGKRERFPNGVLEQYCGERLAQLLAPHERGSVYAQPALLDQVPTRRRDTRLLYPA